MDGDIRPFKSFGKKSVYWRIDMSIENNALNAFSDQLAQAVTKAAEFTVLVNGRRRFPASGISYAKDLIISADHVIERDEDISVVTAGGVTVPGVIAGRDPGNDLALLRLENADLKPAERTNQDARVGEVVIALGRPSREGIEASLGIISAVGGPVRTGRGGLLDRYLRTDVIPLPGFSGGPLINTEGNVVGLNTSGFGHGVGITIPAGIVWSIAEALEKHGYVKRGYLGIRSQLVTLTPEMKKALGRDQETGLLIVNVEAESPAEAGSFMLGDILVGMDEKPISDHDELQVRMTEQAVGKSISIQVLRGGQLKTLNAAIGERK